ncbi:putative methyltransferase-domain-containing protein [Neurospora tetraspora]|uniref:Methyltransferase-domain-containing protein n=1 Tax=Neurospora tetraspora TaxID=94610 RepID=A0AAE0JCY0_9PEZI|nr:putative methyltransferase-domain-containing protein [Neurospora tetraspora]
MHYIRFCRPPLVEQGRSGHKTLKLVLTITTDLSDKFLCPHEPIQLSIIGAGAPANPQNGPVPINLTPKNPPTWRAGMRVLKVDVLLPPQPIETVQVRPTSRQLTALITDDISSGTGDGLILPVFADLAPGPNDHICFRSLRLPGGTATLQVEEEMGESMARHVWDGGLTTASFVANMILGQTAPNAGTTTKASLPMLANILQQNDGPLNIMELGCGVGILGLGVARILGVSSHATAEKSTLLMTDLPDAEERTLANIARSADQTACSVMYENLDWEDGKDGIFGPEVTSRAWDLVILSDCTYNDLLPQLVKTLSAVHDHSAKHSSPSNTKILLSTKPRHSDEREFFDLMSKDGWSIQEEVKLPLPVLNDEAQTVEVYLFSKS